MSGAEHEQQDEHGAQDEPDEVDILYVLTDSGDEYVIPTQHIEAQTALTLGAAMSPFRVVSQGRPEEQMRLG